MSGCFEQRCYTLNMYSGVVIEESLANKQVLEGLKIVKQEIEQVTEAHETPWLSQWTCDTLEIPEGEIDNIAQKFSEAIDTKFVGNWYCDFKNADWHYVIFSGKVFKIDRKNPEGYREMREYALSIGLPEHQLPRFEGFDLQELAKFLVEAKKRTYASGDEAKTTPSREGSNDYEYADGRFVYHDTYFGGVKFIGEEVVYNAEKQPKWAMNYRGETLRPDMSEAAMDAVLRPALSMVGEDTDIVPVRGPRKFERDGYVYEFEVDGTLENFSGKETVSKDGEIIYRLSCNGGMVE